jgi:hypothetical protein
MRLAPSDSSFRILDSRFQPPAMPEQVFFYGTLRTGFNRTTRAGLDAFL